MARVAASQFDTRARLGFYTAALVPAIGFGGYGLIRSDFLALAMAFLGLLFFVLWRMAGEVKSSPLFFSIFSKIEALERDAGSGNRAG